MSSDKTAFEQTPLLETRAADGILFHGYIEPIKRVSGRRDDQRHPGHTIRTRTTLPITSKEYVSFWSLEIWKQLITRYRLAFVIDLETGKPTGEVGVACLRAVKICDCDEPDMWQAISANGRPQAARILVNNIPGSILDLCDYGFNIKFPGSMLGVALVAAKARKIQGR